MRPLKIACTEGSVDVVVRWSCTSSAPWPETGYVSPSRRTRPVQAEGMEQNFMMCQADMQ
eukprot:5129252-Amphidinium_carterae.1